MRIKVLLASFSVLFTMHLQAGSIIVHVDNDIELNKLDVARIYLAKVDSFPNGNKAVPLAQSNDSSIRDRFNVDIVGRDSAQLRAYYARLLFTGKGGPPKEVGKDAEMIDLISKNPSLIGYVDTVPADSPVRVAFEF